MLAQDLNYQTPVRCQCLFAMIMGQVRVRAGHAAHSQGQSNLRISQLPGKSGFEQEQDSNAWIGTLAVPELPFAGCRYA